MKTLLLAAGLAASLSVQNNPCWYSTPTSVACLDGYIRQVEGKVIWLNDRVVSAHATEESYVIAPNGIGFTMEGDFHLNSSGRLMKGYVTKETSFFLIDGTYAFVLGFVELNADSRVLKCELSKRTSLIIPDGTWREFTGYVKFNSNGRVTAGKLAVQTSFNRPDGTWTTVAANKIVTLDSNGRLLRTRDSWDSSNEFEINRGE